MNAVFLRKQILKSVEDFLEIALSNLSYFTNLTILVCKSENSIDTGRFTNHVKNTLIRIPKKKIRSITSNRINTGEGERWQTEASNTLFTGQSLHSIRSPKTKAPISR